MKYFNIVHHDGAIRATIAEDGFATINVDKIEDYEVLFRAINRAFREGAVRGTMFTGGARCSPAGHDVHRRGTMFTGGARCSPAIAPTRESRECT